MDQQIQIVLKPGMEGVALAIGFAIVLVICALWPVRRGR